MRRALTPAEVEGCPVGPCNTSLCRSERDADGEWHLYRLQPDGTEREILPSPEWDDTPFDDLELPDASGDDFERLAEALHQANYRTVRAFLRAYGRHDRRLEALVYPGDAHLMRVMPEQMEMFVEHLGQRRAEWEGRNQS